MLFDRNRLRQARVELVDRRRRKLVPHRAGQTIGRTVAVIIRVAGNQSRIGVAGLKLDDRRERVVAEKRSHDRVLAPMDLPPLVDGTEDESMTHVRVRTCIVGGGR